MYTKEQAQEYREVFREWWGDASGFYDSKNAFNKWLKENTRSELKPCPFCGSEAEVVDRGLDRYCIECTGCSAALGEAWGTEESKSFLTKLWNRRA